MKHNKACPHYADCKDANERMDKIWRYPCPQWIGAKKNAPFDQCMRYEEFEDAIRNNRPAPGEHQEEV